MDKAMDVKSLLIDRLSKSWISSENFDFWAFENLTKEIIEFRPNFSEDDTAFGRLLFSAAGLFFRIKRKLSDSKYIRGKLLVLSREKNNGETYHAPVYQFHIQDDESLLVSFFDAFYNFYSCVNSEAYKKELSLSLGILRDDEKQIIIYDIQNSFPNNAEGSLISKKLAYSSVHKFWDSIYRGIVDNLYINMALYKSLSDYFNDLKETAKEIWARIYVKYSNTFVSKEYSMMTFPETDSITRYIDSYFRLASLCLEKKDVFSQSNNARNIVDRILNIGVGERSGKSPEIEKFWLMSPFALNSLRNVYSRILDFAEDMLENYQDFSDVFLEMFENDFIASCVVDFRRWIYTNGTNSLVTFEGQNNALSKYTYSELSSVTMIRAVRLFEKIKAYMRSHEDKKTIEICIVGYTCKLTSNNKTFLPEIEELKAIVDKEFEGRKVRYTVIMNNHKKNDSFEDIRSFKWDELADGSIRYGMIKYNKLFERTNLYHTLDSFNLLFFLDCPELYFEEFYPETNRDYSAFNRNPYYSGMRQGGNVTMAYDGRLSDIGAQMSVLSNKYPIGSGIYQPMVKEYILDYMNSFVNVRKQDTTVYCYLSTLESRESSKYKGTKIMHIERYNNKLFYIVKMSHDNDNNIQKLPERRNFVPPVFADAVTRPLVFSFWNILKNISIRLKQTIFNTDAFMNDNNTPYYLNKIVIEMSWNKNMDSYCFRYGIDPEVRKIFEKNNMFVEGSKTDLKRILEDIFTIVLCCDDSDREMSVRDDVCNVLLGRASDPIHLLNYYRITLNDIDASDILCEEIDDDNYIKELLNNNQISSVSDKKLYIDTMNSLSYHVDSLGMTAVKTNIQKNGGDPNFILDNISRACEMCNYTDSILYYNLRR